MILSVSSCVRFFFELFLIDSSFFMINYIFEKKSSFVNKREMESGWLEKHKKDTWLMCVSLVSSTVVRKKNIHKSLFIVKSRFLRNYLNNNAADTWIDDGGVKRNQKSYFMLKADQTKPDGLWNKREPHLDIVIECLKWWVSDSPRGNKEFLEYHHHRYSLHNHPLAFFHQQLEDFILLTAHYINYSK